MLKGTILVVDKDEIDELLTYVKRAYFDCKVSCIETGDSFHITIEKEFK